MNSLNVEQIQEIIASYDWPGNLRELNNVMKRATLLARGKYIGAQELEKTMAQSTSTRHSSQRLLILTSINN